MDALKNMLLVLVSPAEVFKYLREKPSWWLPFIILLVATIVLTIATTPAGREIALQQIDEKADQMTSDQLEQAKNMMDSPIMMVFSMIAALIALLITVFIQAGIIHFLMSALGGSGTFIISLTVVLYSSVPTIIRQIIASIYSFKTHELMKMGITSMFGNVDIVSPMGTFLANIDIFIAWQYILLTIGSSIAYKVSKVKAGATAFGIWAAGTAISVGLALIGSLYN